ncbi:MAG: methyltransferase family protein [Desulfobaccales bacterium]
MLIDEFKKTGDWLFRWRSYLPLVLLGLAIPAIRYSAVGTAGLPSAPTAWDYIALMVALAGLGVRVLTVGYVPAGTSGRNTLRQVADSLNITGMYAVVRHPLYLGNFLIWLGISLLLRCWWFTVITVLSFWLYYERIMFAEECFLLERFGEDYRRWAARTPAFIPDFRRWVKPALPFSLKSVISREYSTFFAIVAIFTVFNMIKGWYVRGAPTPDRYTTTLFIGGLIFYLAVRLVKKNTSLLQGDGR